MSRSSSESSETGHREEEGGFINRLRNIPVVKSAVSQASSIYTTAKEANTVTKISLSLAEMSIKAAVESTKFAYNAVPVPGFVGTLKEEAEKKGRSKELWFGNWELKRRRLQVVDELEKST